MSAFVRLMPSCLLALCVACVLVVALSTARAETIDFGRYHALVIGNNDYEHWTPLTTAVRDADEVAELLESKYGFKVELLENATRSQIVRALNRLRGELTEVDNLLIYYAGHGNLDGDVGFWIGVDGDKNFEDSWVSVSTITRNLNHMSARHVLVVADSCYSGTLTRGDDDAGLRTGHKRSTWLERMTHKRARLALTSGGVEPVSDVGGSGHSVFAKEFLEALRENDDVLEGQALFGQIKEDVVVNANQTPDYGKIRLASDDGGDFLFVPREVQIAAQAEQRDFGPQRGASEELGGDFKVWSMIQNSPNPIDLQTFIETFPDSVWVPFARNRLAKLGTAKAPQAAEEAEATHGDQKFTVEPVDLEMVVTAGGRINVREGPGMEFAKSGRLEDKQLVEVTGQVEGHEWYRVRLPDGYEGYVYAGLLGEVGRRDRSEPSPAGGWRVSRSACAGHGVSRPAQGWFGMSLLPRDGRGAGGRVHDGLDCF